MSEKTYRQRLEADLARWQADGVITSAAGDAIRATLRPMPEGVTIANVVAIVGGLLIAAAFLAFIAANWTEIARPLRFAILIAGIFGAYASGAFFAHSGRLVLADLAAAAGSIIFGAAIALTGQMYHLGEDFAGGMFLLAAGAMAAAVLTGSRGALAVALVAGSIWSGMRVNELTEPHLEFIVFWLVAAFLAVAWNSPVARHLLALAAVSWWGTCAFGVAGRFGLSDPTYAFATGVCLLLGGGVLLASRGPQPLTAMGATLSHYGAFALALSEALIVSSLLGSSYLFGTSPRYVPLWILGCGLAAIVCAFAAAAIGRRAGPALAGLSIALALAVVSGWARPLGTSEPWLAYALALLSMLALVLSGMLDDERPRAVAGWIGLAAVIAAITWAVRGSLLRRAAFLAVAGMVAVALASFLGRVFRKERTA